MTINWLTPFLVLSALSFRVAFSTNITISPGDPSLTFSSGWQASRSSASGELFFLVDVLGPVFQVDLPAQTDRVTYVGLKRSGGSIYGICVDCTNDSQLTLIDGHDASLLDNSNALPSTIFTATLNPNSKHVLTVYNVADARFNGQSDLTFSNLVISTPDEDSATVTLSSTSTPAASPVITLTSIETLSSVLVVENSLSGTSTHLSASTASEIPTPSVFVISTSSTSDFPTSTNLTAASDTTATRQLKPSIIATVAVLSAIAVVSVGIGVFLFLRARRRRRRTSDAPSFGFTGPVGRFSIISPPSPLVAGRNRIGSKA